MESNWFFGSMPSLLRVASIGLFTYLGVLLVLRLSGNRTLAKTAAFDHVVTVAFGSVLAATLLSRESSLADGLVAFLVLALLQFVAAMLISRSDRLQDLIVDRPRLVFYQGRMLHEAMLKARVSESQIHAALRQAGVARVADAELVVLESNGQFSVVRKTDGASADVTAGIQDQIPEPSWRC